MKFGVYFLVFSMAFALVLADYENYDDDDEYDDETETDLATTNEDGHLSLFDLIEDLEHLQNPMTAEKRGRKGKGRKGRGKGRKKLSHSKNQKIGACWADKDTYCQICNFKYPAHNRKRYVLCGGAPVVSDPGYVYRG